MNKAAPNVTIAPLQTVDEMDWRRLWGAYQTFYEVSHSEAVHASTWARLLDPFESVHGAIARIDDRTHTAVGLVHFICHRTCWDIADTCYLQDLYVTEATRGSGVGRALIAYVVAQAQTWGSGRVYWLTHHTNVRAIRLYDRVATRTGFTQYAIPLGH
jgi:GNAT superfamily N-acetyltransferase